MFVVDESVDPPVPIPDSSDPNDSENVAEVGEGDPAPVDDPTLHTGQKVLRMGQYVIYYDADYGQYFVILY